MLITIPDLLSPEQVVQCRQALQTADWEDGRLTAGHLAVHAKQNLQLPQSHPLTEQIGGLILDALARSPQFMAAALPLKVEPPRFNRYEGGGTYGTHVDTAIQSVPGTPHRIRTDVSATLFFSEPDTYEGGELVVQDTYGAHTVKLPAGAMVLYPGTSLHHVTPVTRGMRLASFFWIQSLVREDHLRALLWELDQSIQTVTQETPASPAVQKLSGVYHNLLRQWSNT
jgi:PKHD-type hydroxylase